jgi:hypothetical protein
VLEGHVNAENEFVDLLQVVPAGDVLNTAREIQLADVRVIAALRKR